MSLFIGGLHDGEWHPVDRYPSGELPKQWSMVKRTPQVYAARYFQESPTEICTRSDHYDLLEFHVDGHDYRVYKHYKLTSREAFEMLLRGYQHMDLE